MSRKFKSEAAAIIIGLVSVLGMTTSQATIITVASYQLGESDAGAAAGNAGNATTSDSAGTSDLTKVGSTTYSADHAPGVGSLAMAFDGRSYYAGATVTENTENFGISMYVKPTDVSGVQGLAINGSGCCSGFGIFIDSGMYYGLYGGIDVIAIGAAAEDTWAYLALVNEGGVTTSYFNLIANAPVFSGDPHPASAPECCNPALRMTIGSDGTHHFTGLVDQVNVFTFAPGEFTPSDLVPASVPEPASFSLLLFGIAALGFSRRKKA